MSATSDSVAVSHTVTAKASSSNKYAADITALQAQLNIKLGEAKVLARQILAILPSGDSNISAMNSLIAEI